MDGIINSPEMTGSENLQRAITPEGPQNKESLANQKFKYTLVFGQGPVQEDQKIPQSGREGLNFYSRLTALSAAEMLKQGITEKVILSGGQTGARAGTLEAKTEAELMADVIRRQLTSRSKDLNYYIANGKEIPLKDASGNNRSKIDVDGDVEDAYKDTILIENQAKDTLQNFSFILNKYLDQESNPDSSVALLGIGFHAHDTYSGAGIGRLEILADIFDIKGAVYSAEDILKELVIEKRTDSSYVGTRMGFLVETADSHAISELKSRQEKVLVEGLKYGDWIRVVGFLKNPERARTMILQNTYVIYELEKQFGLTKDQVAAASFNDIFDLVGKLKVRSVENYAIIKQAVFDTFEAMSKREGIDYIGKYGKGTIPGR